MEILTTVFGKIIAVGIVVLIVILFVSFAPPYLQIRP